MKFKDTEIKELKAKYGKVFHYQTDDNKYECLFRSPTRSEYGLFDQLRKNNTISAIGTLAETIFLSGDKDEILHDDEYFYGLSIEIMEVITVKTGSLKKL